MERNEAEETIYQECLKEGGFSDLLRQNVVSQKKYDNLLNAVRALTEFISKESSINRRTAGCLFELPWEIENTIDHYKGQDPALGIKVSRMADELRCAINELLWRNIDE